MLQPGVLNFQQSPLYDTYQLAAAADSTTKIVLFETPAGGSKGKNHTNMTRGFELTSPENFEVAALRFVCLGCNEADVLALQKNYVASLIVSGKVALEAPIDFFSGGAGMVIATEAGGTGTSEYAQNGIADPRAIAAIEPGYRVKINSGETFSVELNGTSFTATAAVFMRVYLDGIYGRAVG
jgi:hypothetical protein